MTQAVIIEKNGGPEELKLVDVTVGQPGPGEIRIRHKAIGLNFIDVYQRMGVYPMPMPLPLSHSWCHRMCYRMLSTSHSQYQLPIVQHQ